MKRTISNPIATRVCILTTCVCILLLSALSAQPTAPVAAGESRSIDILISLLAAKGIISAEEAGAIVGSASPAERLAILLRSKGLLSEAELATLLGPATPTSAPPSGMRAPRSAEPVLLASTSISHIPISAPPTASVNAQLTASASVPAGNGGSAAVVEPKPPPRVIPAIAPLRVLPVDPIKRDSVIPDIKLGSGAWLKPYGFVKASLIYDSSSPSGTDMPLPYLNADTGPTLDPEFHVRARNMRIGTQFEWPDMSPKWALTGRFEADFEGNFSRSMNRNISTIRSSMFSVRLAWARLDRTVSDEFSWFVLVGQDWTPFGSSTLPNLVETTGLGLGFGTLYERSPQARLGFINAIGGPRNVKILNEVAVNMPSFGDTPTNMGDQLGYGERQGADSGTPEVQGRFVTQWQFDRAPGVAPAQFITSWVYGRRTALVRATDVPSAFKAAFPTGAEVSTHRYGYTVELQVPTRFATWQGKYFNGQDLRWYFVGGLYSNFNDLFGLTNVATAPSIDGGSTVAFGMRSNGTAMIAPQYAVRTQGFNTDLGLPISRLLNASPTGRMAGWTTNFHYGIEFVPARDARRLSGVRGKDDMAAFTLMYKMNALAALQFEESMYRTRAANSSANDPGGLFILRGVPAREWHDIRSELGILFSF